MKFHKGLHTDNHPSDQPEGTYRHAKNATVYKKRGAVNNEHGTKFLDQLPAGYISIGEIMLPDNRFIIFSVNDSGNSEIGILIKDAYVTILNHVDLNFSKKYPITGTYRVVSKLITSEISEPEPPASGGMIASPSPSGSASPS